MIPVARPNTGAEELQGIQEVLETGWLGLGSVTEEFEKRVADLVGAEHAVAVNTGTSALHLALDAAGIGAGDEVITPSLTFVACLQAILATGATPVFAECHPADLLVDVEDVSRKISARTKAVLPVHYCGNPCDLDALGALAEQHGFRVIEDAAHAFGSMYKGRPIGSVGDLTCFSFDPIKVITCGEGGAVTTDDAEIAEVMRRKRILGIDKETWHRYRETRSYFYEVTTTGFRYHLPNLNAAVGLAQLEKLGDFAASRRSVCRRYDEAFRDLDHLVTLPINYDDVVPFMYVVRVQGGVRDAFMQFLRERGVDTGVHYMPTHQHDIARRMSSPVSLPKTEQVAEEIVTLPLFNGISEDDVETVIAAARDFTPSGNSA